MYFIRFYQYTSSPSQIRYNTFVFTETRNNLEYFGYVIIFKLVIFCSFIEVTSTHFQKALIKISGDITKMFVIKQIVFCYYQTTYMVSKMIPNIQLARLTESLGLHVRGGEGCPTTDIPLHHPTDLILQFPCCPVSCTCIASVQRSIISFQLNLFFQKYR